MAVLLTEAAANEAARVKTTGKYDEGSLLRIQVVAGGCSGFEYAMRFDNNFDPAKDHKYNSHGFDFVVDKKSALYLDGTTVDWVETLERRGFEFNNPKAQRTCGCGKSFQA